MPPPNISTYSLEQLAQAIRTGEYGDLGSLIHLSLSFRQAADDGERDFLFFLRALDLSDPPGQPARTWRTLDVGTFDNFLTRHHICDAARYRTAARTFELISVPIMSTIGFAAARECSKIEDPTRRDRAVRQCEQWAADNSRPPSAQTARKLGGIAPNGPTPAAQRRQALEEQVERLRAEIQRLRNLVVKHGGDPDEKETAAAE